MMRGIMAGTISEGSVFFGVTDRGFQGRDPLKHPPLLEVIRSVCEKFALIEPVGFKLRSIVVHFLTLKSY
jgi:hypothetical protein